ncbi:MAG: transposase [Candidatus Coatesbacteria bacterium]|nr:transposase [Candidatus Coatesbacteria bacterium]
MILDEAAGSISPFSPDGIKKEAEVSGMGFQPMKERVSGKGFQPMKEQASGKGFQPMKEQICPMKELNHRQDADATTATSHRQDADATNADATDSPLVIRHGAYLPHWTREGATYSVTFRLADSLPAGVFQSWKLEREKITFNAESQNRALTEHEEKRLSELIPEKLEKYLNDGHGECWLKDGRIAVIVRDALRHFDGERYEIAAWCVMPNHVHVVVRPKAGHTLSDILHSWKSFTANRINQVLGRTGAVWQAESYDHLLRDEQDFQHAVAYILDNPRVAGLENWPWCGMGFQP